MTERTESEVLLDVAVLGEQVDQFLKSDVGQFILEHAVAEEAAGIEALKRLDCHDADAIRAAQNRVWRGESVRAWLEEATIAGLKARMILEDRQE